MHGSRRAAVRLAAALLAQGAKIAPHVAFLAAGGPRRASSGLASMKLLVANRGEIACRVLATTRRLGVPTVAVYSDADRDAKFVAMADEAYRLGPAPAQDSYLRGDMVLAAAKAAGATAIHPGYGFLSENAPFAAPAIRAMGDKAEAKAIMSGAGVPVVPGYHGGDQSDDKLAAEAASIGFPLLVKAVAGGGGKGMKLANSQAELPLALSLRAARPLPSFANDVVLLERYITRPRHVEVQVLADSHGGCVYVYDRDCSVQRRHQKIIEEAPAPWLPKEFHAHIGEAAVRAARAVGYVNAGTVEFIVDVDTGDFYFMEMNTRLQVEHPVSEAVSGLDLVELQLRVAAGEVLPITQEVLDALGPRGHAFEARLYAESPSRGFLPGAGRVRRWRTPAGTSEFEFPHWHSSSVAAAGGTAAALLASSSSSGGGSAAAAGSEADAGGGVATVVRVDSGVREGDDVGINYDPMIAKLVATGPTREAALAALRTALANTQVAGLPTNLGFLQRLAAHPAFSACELDTGFIGRYEGQLLAAHAPSPAVAALAAVARSRVQAAAVAAAHPPQPAMGAWEVTDSKRLWGLHTKTLTMAVAEADGQQQELVLTQRAADEYEVRVSPDAPPVAVCHVTFDPSTGRLAAAVGGKKLSADVLVHPAGSGEAALVLWLEGKAHEFRWPQPAWSKDADAPMLSGGGEVVSPMPGQLVRLLVAEGQGVEVGQPLLVMAAMKMEHTLQAPRAGVVRGVSGLHVGVQLEDGQLLLRVADGQQGEAAAAKATAAGAA